MTALDIRAPAAATGPFIRQAVEADRAALAGMFDRCSEQTRYRRFHAPVRRIPERYLNEALASVPEHYALVAVAPSGTVTALASSRTVASGAAELGVLVEDGSQRLGLGRFLLHNLIHQPERPEVSVFRATILREQAWIIRLLSEYGTCHLAPVGHTLDVTVRLVPGKGGPG